MTYIDPRSAQDWQDVGDERRSDAGALETASRTVGEIYFLGFALEAYAKALCIANGKTVPTGHTGHDVVAILNRAGFSRAVLAPELRKFAEERDVALRYQVSMPPGVDHNAERACAKRLIQWCVTRLSRPVRSRRNKP